MRRGRCLFLSLLFPALAGLAAAPASAQSELIDSAFGTCTAQGCSDTRIGGWVGNHALRIVPWTAKVLAEAGNCLNLNVVFQQSGNLEMVVVAPDGVTVYRNDQSNGGCGTCPRVKIDPTPLSGYYTAILSNRDGSAADTVFHLGFGQYNHGNINCSGPTPPLP